MKKLIGLVPSSNTTNTPDTSACKDGYRLGNNYIKRIYEAGMLPIGLAPADNWIPEEALDACDAFVVQGGSEFYPYHFQVIHHAIKTGKKYLGVCLGQQLIYVYLKLVSILEEEGYEGDTVKGICEYLAKQPEGFTLQKRIPDHANLHPLRGEEESTKHDVDVVPGTLLHKVLGRDKMRICSFHKLCTPPEQTLVKINAWSSLGDGVVEGTEYGDNILGVQGHPEADGLLPELFCFLTND